MEEVREPSPVSARSHTSTWTHPFAAVTVPSLIPPVACLWAARSGRVSACTWSHWTPSDRARGRGRVHGRCVRRTASVRRHAIGRSHSSQIGRDGGRAPLRVMRRSERCSSTARVRACIASVNVHGRGPAAWEHWAAHTSTPSASTAFGSALC